MDALISFSFMISVLYLESFSLLEKCSIIFMVLFFDI